MVYGKQVALSIHHLLNALRGTLAYELLPYYALASLPLRCTAAPLSLYTMHAVATG